MDKKEETKVELKKYIESGNSILYKDIKNNNYELLWKIYKYLGNIGKACNSIGIDNKELKAKYGFQTKEEPITEKELISRLSFLHSIGEIKTKNLLSSGGYFEDNRLYNYLKRRFKSIDKGLEYFGFENQYKWTDERIERELKQYESEGLSMSYQEISSINPKLVHAVRNHFSSYYKGLDYYGINYMRKYNVISESNLIERMDAIISECGCLNYSIIKKRDPSVLYFSYEKYGSLRNAMNELGYEEYIEEHPDVLVSSGWEFEKIFCKILDCLEVEYIFNKSSGSLRPDFQLKNNIWIDTKLSSWTPTIQDTIDKYHTECDRLIIVYMRGHKDILKYYKTKKNTSIVSVDEIIKSLPEDDKKNINNKIEELKSNIENIVNRND